MHLPTNVSRYDFLQGNAAVVHGAIAAGVNFFAGYPITPSTEIAEMLSHELPKIGGKFIQMEDELASISAIIGASAAGAKSMTATSGPGFSLMMENLGLAAMLEMPCVIVDVQRGGPSTGLPTKTHQGDMMQVRWGSHGDYPIIALIASTVAECFELCIKSFNLSERYRSPVVLLLEEVTAHMRENVFIPAQEDIELWERPRPTVRPEEYMPYDDSYGDVPPFTSIGEGYRFNITGLIHDVSGFPTERPDEINELMARLKRKISEDNKEFFDVEYDGIEDSDVLVFAYGSSARASKGAIKAARKKGLRVGLMRPRIIWPFPRKALEGIASRFKQVIVPELNQGQIVGEVERAVAGKAPVHFIGRIDGEMFSPLQILEKIEEVCK
jgi:2-oxoglutarate/2-oxoacid ferredoxin oxidoreductase subunit alpha